MGNATLTDSDGLCKTPEVAESVCPNISIKIQDSCPGDRPSLKQSCTLCTLDGYNWCPSGHYASTSEAEYEGTCTSEYTCKYQSLFTLQSHRGHGIEQHDSSAKRRSPIYSAQECQLAQNMSEFARAIAALSAALWLASLLGCCCLSVGGVFFYIRQARFGRQAWLRSRPYVPPAGVEPAPMQHGHPHSVVAAEPVAAPPGHSGPRTSQSNNEVQAIPMRNLANAAAGESYPRFRADGYAPVQTD
eukprot:CAMPEP_0170179314 /NCGR_PEP_ID=MMETSP0040_2-20121228/17251_1 /TAXON_ID=641309 /ORGANISM="Lotharella oceanica, Strain CCMP622" /LENGTH=244 /DNA_ID=CAMNT_0010423325 /DNA_START=151 /DNA_END=885 /DNA_ORIENTATION=-